MNSTNIIPASPPCHSALDAESKWRTSFCYSTDAILALPHVILAPPYVIPAPRYVILTSRHVIPALPHVIPAEAGIQEGHVIPHLMRNPHF